ncbi:MAG TPA: amino acid transporter [Bacteroidales bacterium]|nr:amino acid transporter [Bacteroidales bacterium]
MSATLNSTASGPGLKRVLGLSSLVLYGIILIQPTAPMPLFGAAASLAKGHVVTTVLIGMVAMMFTAVSYGRMANVYPNAGSAYTYVGREIHPSMGYFIGWGMIFDYVMNPIICIIWASKACMNFIPEIPFAAYAIFFALLFTGMNLRGIEASAKTNMVIAVGLGIVIVLFLGSAIRYLFINPPVSAADWTKPFYDPQTFSFKTVSTGASLAVLTYIGFDGISTLSEEVHNPRRNILFASVLVCIITGVLAAIQVYTAQMVWPETTFPDQDTAFCYVAGRAGGQWLFNLVNVALLIATIGSGSGAHLGAGRLLYGMGRDNAIPGKFFAKVHPKTRIPSNNIVLVGIFALLGAFTLTYPLGAQLLNFGALIAFMGVNASSFVHYYLRGKRNFSNFIVPVLGFLICLYLWLSLGTKAKIVGICWLSLGLLYGAYRTSWFRKPLQFSKIETDENGK